MSATLKVQKKRPWSSVPDDILTNKSLSAVARLVLAYLVGRPGDWVVYVAQVQRVLGLSEARWARARKELAAAGYYSQNRLQNKAGQWVWENIVTDTPTIPSKSMDGETIPRFSRDGKSGDITKDLNQQDLNKEIKPPPPPPPMTEVAVDFSYLIKSEIRPALMKMLQRVEINERQLLIDDLLGYMSQRAAAGKPVNNPVGILRTMLERYKPGEWVPDLAHVGRWLRESQALTNQQKARPIALPEVDPLILAKGAAVLEKGRQRRSRSDQLKN